MEPVNSVEVQASAYAGLGYIPTADEISQAQRELEAAYQAQVDWDKEMKSVAEREAKIAAEKKKGSG